MDDLELLCSWKERGHCRWHQAFLTARRPAPGEENCWKRCSIAPQRVWPLMPWRRAVFPGLFGHPGVHLQGWEHGCVQRFRLFVRAPDLIQVVPPLLPVGPEREEQCPGDEDRQRSGGKVVAQGLGEWLEAECRADR